MKTFHPQPKMYMKRREFLKTSVVASAAGGLAAAFPARASQAASMTNLEYYEMRSYRFKSDATHAMMHHYLEHALIPAMNRLGSKPVGVFMQQERTTPPAKTEVRDANSMFVLIPYLSIEAFAMAGTRLQADAEYQKAAAAYLGTPQSAPAYERIDVALMRAFTGLPRIELQGYSKERKPRMFELRTYESHSEEKALKKIEMFNSGEIEVMKEIGMAPVFYGQVLAGHDLPHLTYMLSAENSEAHQKHWGAFGKHPTWNKMKDDPQYKDTVSQIHNRFLVPTAYSQI
jgi:hypothetical protein